MPEWTTTTTTTTTTTLPGIYHILRYQKHRTRANFPDDAFVPMAGDGPSTIESKELGGLPAEGKAAAFPSIAEKHRTLVDFQPGDPEPFTAEHREDKMLASFPEETSDDKMLPKFLPKASGNLSGIDCGYNKNIGNPIEYPGIAPRDFDELSSRAARATIKVEKLIGHDLDHDSDDDDDCYGYVGCDGGGYYDKDFLGNSPEIPKEAPNDFNDLVARAARATIEAKELTINDLDYDSDVYGHDDGEADDTDPLREPYAELLPTWTYHG